MKATITDLAVLCVLAAHDIPDGHNDAAIQRMLGKTPAYEAIDRLKSADYIIAAQDVTGKPKFRTWCITRAGITQLERTSKMTVEETRAAIDPQRSPHMHALERERLAALCDLVEGKGGKPITATGVVPPPPALPKRPEPRHRSPKAPSLEALRQKEAGPAGMQKPPAPKRRTVAAKESGTGTAASAGSGRPSKRRAASPSP